MKYRQLPPLSALIPLTFFLYSVSFINPTYFTKWFYPSRITTLCIRSSFHPDMMSLREVFQMIFSFKCGTWLKPWDETTPDSSFHQFHQNEIRTMGTMYGVAAHVGIEYLDVPDSRKDGQPVKDFCFYLFLLNYKQRRW